MDKITEALKKLVPAEQLADLTTAVNEMIEQAKQELEAEYNKNLEEAYEELAAENRKSEEVAEEGYRQAWDIISELRNRMDTMKAEYADALDEGYTEAYQALLEEKDKNKNIETELYEEFERRFEESKGYIVDKVDAFLKLKGKEIYEQAKRDVMSDPAMVEHKIVLENIVETLGDYISDEDRVVSTSNKLETMKSALEAAQTKVKMLEARNIKLSTDNNKLNEAVKQAKELITEGSKQTLKENRKERTEMAKQVSGRGDSTIENTKVISETVDVKETKTEAVQIPSGLGSLEEQLVLAGLKKNS